MNESNDFIITHYKELKKFVKIVIKYKTDEFILYSPFKGEYNVYNVVMSFAIAYLYGIKPEILIAKIKKLKPISGRREYLNFGQKFDIVLDYAHTINGIQSVLNSFKSTSKKIIVVTGCAGGSIPPPRCRTPACRPCPGRRRCVCAQSARPHTPIPSR